jgi:TDG/mug DNA glycosylase family protein
MGKAFPPIMPLRVKVMGRQTLPILRRDAAASSSQGHHASIQSESLMARGPSQAELQAAAGASLPDVIAPGLRVLFCGINPSLYTAAVGHHFARPGNRFWPTLHRAGFTPRQLRPVEEAELLALGYGITNIVDRATARAEELKAAELKAGSRRLLAKVEAYAPLWIAVLGVSAYRTAWARPQARIGPQAEVLGGARLWVLPNPSGLNAHYGLAALAEAFGALRAQL